MKKILFLFLLLLFSCYNLDDGPFKGSSLSLKLHESLGSPDYSLPYRGGTIEIFNRNDDEFPVIVFRKKNKVVWSAEMKTTVVEQYEHTYFSEIESPVLTKGLFKDHIDFTGYWTYGAEHGYAYFTKNRFIEFYLSW